MKKSFEEYLKDTGEVGYVEQVLNSVVLVSGLPGGHLGEMVWFESGEMGQVSSLKRDGVEVLILSHELVGVGTKVTRTGQRMAVGVSEEMMGLTIDVIGRPINGSTPKVSEDRWVDVTPLGIVHREKVNEQLVTGVILVDLLIPIGKGQRELVLGDRKTGKSFLLMQIIRSQAKQGTVCIYAAVGKKKSEIRKVEEFLQKEGVLKDTIIVATSSHDSAGEIFLCPYTAMGIAEYFRDKGRDVLVVMDDMSTHAKFYRELSLLSRKFPGRDSYPGDIFHIHSKLLERAGNFVVGDKVASITCLPVAETVQGDITGYIQTNLMSMTDGHIYFDSDLFFKGRRPAINPFVSVTRVGHQTQKALGRDAGRVLIELLNNYEKTQSFLRFGAELGENSRQILAMGDKVLAFFDQPIHLSIPVNLQLTLLALLVSGLWQGNDITKLITAYETDQAYRGLVDKLIEASPNMGKLMEESRKASAALMAKLST